MKFNNVNKDTISDMMSAGMLTADSDVFTVHIIYDYPSRTLSVASDQNAIAGTEGDVSSTKVMMSVTGEVPAERSFTMMFDVRVLDEHKVTTRYADMDYDASSGEYVGWIPPDVFNNTLHRKLPIQLKVEWVGDRGVKHRFYSFNILTFQVMRRI